MFGQLLPNKNKIATVWRDIYYAKFASQIWDLNRQPLFRSLCAELQKSTVKKHIIVCRTAETTDNYDTITLSPVFTQREILLQDL
jgi:hypothetical protein